MSTSAPRRLHTPDSDSSTVYTELGYLDAYDAVLDCDYAFVAWQEKSRGSDDWRVRIKSSQTAGGEFDPAMIRSQARRAGAQGQPWFKWGYDFAPSSGDPRHIEFRVHVTDGEPREIEIFVRLRKADHTAGEPRSLRIPWPRG